MVPPALRGRAPDVDAECYLAVRNGLPSAVAAAQAATTAAGVDVVALAVLVPCRAAMLAKFPLHGTYFQTNEVFLDAETATRPWCLPAYRLTHLPTVSVYLGTSVASICRGMSRAEVASSFANRAVCVRSWDPATGHPRPLPRWACPFMPRGATALPAPGEELAPVVAMPSSPQDPALSSAAASDAVDERLRQQRQLQQPEQEDEQQQPQRPPPSAPPTAEEVRAEGAGGIAPPANVEVQEGDMVHVAGNMVNH